MLYSCWSAKGGSGTTVVAATLAMLFARRSDAGALFVDAGGDAAAVLGVPEPDGPGVADWLAAGDGAPIDSLRRLEVDLGANLRLVPHGGRALPAGAHRAELLAELLATDRRDVVVDCGLVQSYPSSDVPRVLAAAGTRSLLVTRPCYLSLRRAGALPFRPSAVVLVDEPGRALTPADVEAVLDVPVLASVVFDPAIARAVDAGLLMARLPRPLERVAKWAS